MHKENFYLTFCFNPVTYFDDCCTFACSDNFSYFHGCETLLVERSILFVGTKLVYLGWEFFSSPPFPERLWGPSSLLSNGYQ
jgi:hypothetical protein